MKIADRLLLPILLAGVAGLFIATAGWGDLYNETDGQYAAAAKVMAQGGSWLIPENNGTPRLVKPPLLYWAMAAAMKTFGINAFSARLPGALAILLWVAATYGIAAKIGGSWRGFLAGAILLSSLGLFTLGRIVMPEPLFSAFIACSLYCLLSGVSDPGRRARWFLGVWGFAALASFCKGGHGLLYVLLIAGLAALLCPPARRDLRGLLSWQGAAIFLAINLPWYVWVESHFPGWMENLFWTEQLGHVSGSSDPATDYAIVPRWQFLLLHLAWLFPWSLVAISVFFQTGVFSREVAKSRRRELSILLRGFAASRDSFPNVLIISWALIILASVLLAGQRQDYYAMSMWPCFAIALAAGIEGRSLRTAAIVLALLMGLGFLAALAIPPFLAGGGSAGVAERATAWTTVTNFDGKVWLSLRHTALWALGGATVFAVVAVILGGRKQILALLALACALALGAINGMSLVSPYFSLARIAPLLKASMASHPDGLLVYDGGLDTGSSLLFYTALPVAWLDQNPDEDFFTRKFGIGRDLYLSSSELARIWSSGTPILLVTEESKLPHWESLMNSKLLPIAKCGTQIVLKN